MAVIEGSHVELVGPLRDGNIDIMLGTLRRDGGSDDVNQEEAFEDRSKVIMRDGHPLASKTQVSPTDLRRFPWALPAASTPLRQFWADLVADAEHQLPHVSIECGSVATLREILLQTDSLTLFHPIRSG